jgi:hypothetical protein
VPEHWQALTRKHVENLFYQRQRKGAHHDR